VELQMVAAVTALAASGLSLWRWYTLRGDTERPPDEVGRLQVKAAVSAGLFLVASVTGGASAVLRRNEVQRERHECQSILSALASSLQDELAGRPDPGISFEDSLGLGDTEDVDVAMADEADAFEGVRLEPATPSSLDGRTYDVTRDGTFLGAIDESGIAVNRCDHLSA
jgi:hypothetical protein